MKLLQAMRVGVVGTGVLGSLPGLAAENGVTADTILVGQSASLTGAAGELGQQVRDGALAYFDSINGRGGIHGRKIRLITVDDAGQTAKGAENTQRLIAQDKVFVLCCYTGRNTAEAALPLVSSKKVPFFGAASGADSLHAEFNRYVFNVRAGYGVELEKIADYLVTVGYKRIAFLHLSDDTKKLNLRLFEAALARHNVKLVAESQIDRNLKSAADVKPALAKFLQASPDVVGMVGPAKTLATFIVEARKAGMTSQWVSLSFAGKPLFTELKDESTGVIMAQVVPIATKNRLPLVREYQQAMAKYMPKAELSFNSLEGYIAAKTLVVGLNAAGRELTRDKFIAALERQKDLDLGDFYLSYSNSNHNGSRYVNMVMYRRDGSFID
jgi:ABC-type branched-subunit amino acid transport system substrate-binding protein